MSHVFIDTSALVALSITSEEFHRECREKYEEYKGDFESNAHGSLVASETGETRGYGLIGAEGRGELFMGPGVHVYEGQIVGHNAKSQDLRVNVCKEKQLSNHIFYY